MRRTMLWGVWVVSALLVPLATPAVESGAAPDWRADFEAVCSQTDSSMSLTDEELVRLIARCDRLAELIASEPEVVRRMYRKRLQRCRDLFAYVLDSRTAAAASDPAAGRAAGAPSEPPAAPPSAPASP